MLLVIASLAACNRAPKEASNDAVRQGVVEYLAGKGFPKDMNVTVTKVETRGKEADATVSMSAPGGDAKSGMTMRYRLEQKGDKWTVVGRSETGGGAHEGAGTLKAPAGSEPHAGAPGAPGAAPPGGSPKMPSPDDLPPAKK